MATPGIKSKAIFLSKRMLFDDKNASLIDMVTGHMALDIEIALKTRAGMPVKTGAMKSGTRHFRSTKGGFRVEIDKEYAAYQERGMRRDGSYRVKNYSSSGSSAGFFARAIDMIVRNRVSYISEVRRALDL